MSRRNPFEKQPPPASIHEPDPSDADIIPALPTPEGPPRKRNPFVKADEDAIEAHEIPNGANGHVVNGQVIDHVANNGDRPGPRTSFQQLPTFGDTPRPLNSRDVCAFIVNKMVGTGIYTSPPLVLFLTRSKGLSLALWFIGFGYTIISMIIYLEFARRLPHTGGELIYLDETLPRPRLLAYTMYTFYFVLLYNTATNCMQFAKQVLICAAGDVSDPVLDQRSLRFIAVVILSFFVLLHYFSGRAGRDLNQVLAVVKYTLLAIVFFAGIARATKHYTADWGISPNSDASSSAIAFLYIVFSFTGWENATFVGGEIRDHRILRRGFIAAVVLVGTMYILINLIFLLAVPADFPTTHMASLFFGDGYNARRAWAVLIAVSASGSLLSVSYTCARVKQVIGMSNVIPWSRIWKSNSPPRRDENGNFINAPTPQGGLLLHWIFSIVLISTSSAFSDITEAVSFPGNLQAYASGWVGIFMSFGFPFLFLNRDSRLIRMFNLNARRIPVPTPDRFNLPDAQDTVQPTLVRKLYWPLTIIYLIFNGYIVVVTVIPPYTDGSGNKLQIKGWYYAAIVGVIAFLAVIYYLVTFAGAPCTSGDITPHIPGQGGTGTTIAKAAGVHLVLFERGEHNPQYGFRRGVEVVIDRQEPSFLYWLFGGSQRRHWRAIGLFALWDWMVGR